MKRTAALVLASTLVLSACSGIGRESEAPKEALISAMKATGASEGLTFRLSLQSTPESLDALAKDGGEGIAEEDAQKILDSSITLSGQGEGNEGSFEMAVNVAGEDDFELKSVDQTLYLRADVTGLVDTFGGDPAEIAKGVQALEAQGLTFVRPLAEGEWVSLEGFGEASQQLTGQSPPAVPQQQEIIDELTKSFEEDATVTSQGTDDAGEHLTVALPLRETYERFLNDFANLGAQLPPGARFPDASEVPDEDITLDVWIEDDRVTQLELDLLQIAAIAEEEEVPEGVERFAFRTEIDEFNEEVEAPEDAVAIDPQQIFGLIGSIFSGLGGATGSAPAGDVGAGFNCDDLKGAPPSVLEQYAEECPELQP